MSIDLSKFFSVVFGLNLIRLRIIEKKRTIGYHCNMRRKISAFCAIFLICLLLLSSCVVTESLTLSGEITKSTKVPGKSHSDISVDDFFVGVMEDLSNWTDKGNNDPVIDVAIHDFESNVKASRGTGGVSFTEIAENTYTGDFSFTDFATLLVDLSNGHANQSIVTIRKADTRTHVEININMENYEELTEIIPFLADPNFEVYGPLYNNDLTEEEYLEMVSFILGEQCPDSIGKSNISIVVSAPKAIVSHNGKLRDSKTVEFSFPLIDFLLLHHSIDFYLEY